MFHVCNRPRLSVAVRLLQEVGAMCTFLPEHANRRRSCRERKTRQDAALCSWLAMDHEPRNWAIVSRSMTMQMQMQMQMQRKRKRKCEVTPKCEREIHTFS